MSVLYSSDDTHCNRLLKLITAGTSNANDDPYANAYVFANGYVYSRSNARTRSSTICQGTRHLY